MLVSEKLFDCVESGIHGAFQEEGWSSLHRFDV